MKTLNTFYIAGQWVAPSAGGSHMDIVDPATETLTGQLSMGTARDADRAVAAARAAFPAWSESSRATRIELLERIIECYRARLDDIAEAVRMEIGAPITLCKHLQAAIGLAQLQAAVETLRHFEFETDHGKSTVRREAVGVAALITPWNWPLNQIAAKVAPALAAGCTVVLKPSEIAPLDAVIFAEIMHEAGTPPGVFNMIFGDGRVVGARLSSHPDVDMVSITGSTRAGVEVAISAAPTVKRVAQELGGKSPLLILDDADLKASVTSGVAQCMVNSGQTCVAPTRMLVPRERYDEAIAIAAAVANGIVVGDPADPATKMGPISNRGQYEKVQQMIRIGMEEGARVVAGGPGRPEGLTRGFYARPTVFADVRNDMKIAREEIFGPVLVLIPYDDEEQAIAIANDTPYGLAAYVATSDVARARRVAARLRAGSVRINGAMLDITVPFGGYKTSGNGREYGREGLMEFLECKSVTV
ncbi:aldehyde dehydrogenase family protein [Caballeronia insecticola]|uniref:Betaine-aldehyde dehydrogenase n=1 Tax=Caballeronia insecticola TaxID=758793 RepID=R4X0A9_9BURK|nr:aldehyde dehydrogenase family protein [Caballeronia insecticola]BAN27595.1 betaine-aldehyde dehydrogenase [Caballeronia insecticola]